jgi:protein phosphatase
MRMFAQYGAPNESNEDYICDMEGLDYLFLGNYVDRGRYSLEVICLLFTLKIKFPGQIHLLRGAHEDTRINKVYGFAEECQQRLMENPSDANSVYAKINKVFEYLPLAAVVANKIFCVHSGIGATLRSIEEIEMIQRPLTINYEGVTSEHKIVMDLLWSDPVLNESENDTRVT